MCNLKVVIYLIGFTEMFTALAVTRMPRAYMH